MDESGDLMECRDLGLMMLFAEEFVYPVYWKHSTLFSRGPDTWYRLRFPNAKYRKDKDYSEIVEKRLSPKAREVLRAMFLMAKSLYLKYPSGSRARKLKELERMEAEKRGDMNKNDAAALYFLKFACQPTLKEKIVKSDAPIRDIRTEGDTYPSFPDPRSVEG